MGARTIRKRKDPVRHHSIRRRQESLTFWKIAATLVFPMLLAVALVGIDIRSDLSELKSNGKPDEWGAIPLGWPALEGNPVCMRPVRMIGYMMDGYQPSRDGAKVDMFILLPEAGQFLHPAHRIRNQMVEVRPQHPVVFQYRELVWASGILSRTIGAGDNGGGTSGDEKAGWAMSGAEVSPAIPRDIGKWFHP